MSQKKTDDRVYVIIIRIHGFYVKCSQIYFENKNEKIVKIVNNLKFC